MLFQPLSAHKLYDVKLCLAFFEVGFLDFHFYFHSSYIKKIHGPKP